MKIPLFRPFYSKVCIENILSGINKILNSGNLMMGEFKDKFENLFCEKLGIPYSVSVNTCSTALTICLNFFDVNNHDVLVPSGSFITSISSIIFAGGNPVLVDMNPQTLSFELDDLKKKLTTRTKGIVWVHLTGVISPEFKEIVEFAKKHGLFLIEDAAHALGAHVNGKHAGTIGDAGCFSFYPTKIISAGTGGMIATDNIRLRDFAEQMRLFGKNLKTGEVENLGNDWFLDEIRACVGYYQLNELDANMSDRRRIAEIYSERLTKIPQISTLNLPQGNFPSFYQYPVFFNEKINRQKVISNLKMNYEIEAKGIYKPCHQEKVFQKYDDKTLSNTEKTLDSSLCLPIYFGMNEEDVFYVIEAIKKEVLQVS